MRMLTVISTSTVITTDSDVCCSMIEHSGKGVHTYLHKFTIDLQ